MPRGVYMEKVIIQQIEEAMPGLRRLEDCKCYKPGFGFTCKAKDVGLDEYVVCLERDACRCPYSLSYGHSYYCTCPARVHLVKKLKK
jgi:hypothetical protein